MATLEKVMQLKQQGMSEGQIIQSLKQEGVSPKEINESLSQSKIKSELSAEQQQNPMPQPTVEPGAVNQINSPTETSMQPSIMSPENTQSPQEITSSYQPSAVSYQQEVAPPATSPGTEQLSGTEQYPPQSSAPQEYYQEEQAYPEYQPQQPLDIETINDIAEQIIDEKINKLQKQITSFSNFKEELGLEVQKINERLQKIENTFNELQMAILGKIGDYGKDIQNISKEMHATQDSFSKILNPLTDNIRELQKITGSGEISSPNKPNEPQKQGRQKKSKTNFESYLR